MYSDQDIANLVARVQQLEAQAMVRQNASLPNIKLVSPNFLSRAFAVWGHNFVASLLISIVVSCIGGIILLLVGGSILSIIQNAIQQFGLGL